MLATNMLEPNELMGMSDFSKKMIIKSCKALLSFLRQTDVCKDEKSPFPSLMLEIDANRIGIPLPVQDKIDSFIADYLEPLLYETDAEKLSDMLAKAEKAWEKLARELHYYLML